MNIFWFDLNPTTNARMHCDKHVVKMPLELAQMLSSAHHTNGSPLVHHVYKRAYPKHPCTMWIAHSASAYYETYLLFEQLLIEYTFRYGKRHKCEDLLSYLDYNPCPDVPSRSKPMAMPSKYVGLNVVKAYQNYFCGDKRHIANWSHRPVPNWYK